ncbi:MAG: 23S rRNA (pseudouridine(1915)-N(3))-methyltransferase RlmH [Oscillospiraceae bacterium]
MNINFIAMGKLKESWYREACAEYMKRLGAYISPKVIEPSPVDLPQKPSQAQIDAALRQEAAKIREQIKPGSFTVAMCIEARPSPASSLRRSLKQRRGGVQYGELPCGELLRAGRELKKQADLRLPCRR